MEIRALTADEIECRVGQIGRNGNGLSLLLYKDARCDMKILDEVYGSDNWQCFYEEIHGSLFCTVTVLTADHGWVSKQDVGTPSNMEREKGEASDAFKRACFKVGIGRELYTAPFIWVPADLCNIKTADGKQKCFDRFKVTEFEVEDGKITKLTIFNETKGVYVYGSDKPAAAPKAAPKASTPPKPQSAPQQAPTGSDERPMTLEESKLAFKAAFIKFRDYLPIPDKEQRTAEAKRRLTEAIGDVSLEESSATELSRATAWLTRQVGSGD